MFSALHNPAPLIAVAATAIGRKKGVLAPRKAFDRHVKRALKQVALAKKAKKAKKEKSRKRHIKNAEKHLAAARSIYRRTKKGQTKKGKWTSSDQRHHTKAVAKVTKALVDLKLTKGKKKSSRTVTKPMTLSQSAARVVGGRARRVSASAPVYGEEFEPSDEALATEVYEEDADVDADVYMDEDTDMDMAEEAGPMAKIKRNPLMAVAGVALISGVAFAIYQRRS